MAQIQQEKNKLNLTPKRFNMWVFIFTSFMFFAALSSGFIVYSGGKGHALNVILPDAFMFSTAIIVLSSVTMFLASKAAKNLQFGKQRLFLWITFLLGVGFFIAQIYGWYILTYRMGVYFSNPNASQSFIYVFSGMHLLHILAGLVLLIISLVGTYRNTPQVLNLFRMEMSSIFWHFVDIIWIYLYVFLLLNQN
ncbi:cytochrome c oxidase subunit 3 [Mucilaginibacter sp. Bleaf8]|uniref:cytochrome c oxidase subunit 3 n=1 Tax=Mucilaginibacter sp. Bleaf8 TaxID=2834430 RepID=UPI001BD17D84|nr:cytochrome c oxidase subunit 3 [Mucilaginibacter sp. Bleaf8]MBS7566126.1 cytochrome c oxidase subunit 3 [Mucilaginibacter sp. Bleaf8]